MAKRTTKRGLLTRIYSQIPTFECVEGCTDCCGPVPWAPIEWGGIQDKRVSHTTSCPYECEKGCEVYESRPLMCRLFGTTENQKLACPHGKGPDKKLTEMETARLLMAYETLGAPSVPTHPAPSPTGRMHRSEPRLQNIPIRTELGSQIRAALRKGFK